MILKNILIGIEYLLVQGTLDISINELKYDSRNIISNDVFICINGTLDDGNKYINDAVLKGATVIITNKNIKISPHITVVKVDDTREALAIMSSNYYGNPKNYIKIIGITGTNGKTTTSYMIRNIFKNAGFKTALIGTICNYIGDKKIETDKTTPESLELHKLLREMVDNNITHCIMEISSHSLALKRTYGITFEHGVFTNITHDHLDFHGNFYNYYHSKKILFINSKNSIINIDNEYGKSLLIEFKNRYTYSLKNNASISAKILYSSLEGSSFYLNYKENSLPINLKIAGLYNIHNALAASMVGILEGVSLDLIKFSLENLPIIEGRFQYVCEEYPIDYKIIIDFAHSPDAIEKILNTVKSYTDGRIITVFGCVGNGDRDKRPIMGQIATDLSDYVIITTDNPKNEDPQEIINDIKSGISSDNYSVEIHRPAAIKKALSIAKKNDIVLIAGRGHESSMKVKDRTLYFTDEEVAIDFLERRI